MVVLYQAEDIRSGYNNIQEDGVLYANGPGGIGKVQDVPWSEQRIQSVRDGQGRLLEDEKLSPAARREEWSPSDKKGI